MASNVLPMSRGSMQRPTKIMREKWHFAAWRKCHKHQSRRCKRCSEVILFTEFTVRAAVWDQQYLQLDVLGSPCKDVCHVQTFSQLEVYALPLASTLLPLLWNVHTSLSEKMSGFDLTCPLFEPSMLSWRYKLRAPIHRDSQGME